MTVKETLEKIKNTDVNWTDYDLAYGCVFCGKKITNILINETLLHKWIQMLFVCKNHRDEIWNNASSGKKESYISNEKVEDKQ